MDLRLAAALVLAIGPLEAASLQGRILTDDGLPLPASSRADLRCQPDWSASSSFAEGGWFEFKDLPVPADCSFSVSAPGYRRAEVPSGALPADPRIPALVLYRLGKGQGESMSASHLSVPEPAVRSFHSAVRALEEGAGTDPQLALQHLASAVRVAPWFACAWFEIGRLRLALGDPAGAVEAFREAVRTDPWFVSPYEPLILLLESSGNSDGAREACAGLRKINPALPESCGTS